MLKNQRKTHHYSVMNQLIPGLNQQKMSGFKGSVLAQFLII